MLRALCWHLFATILAFPSVTAEQFKVKVVVVTMFELGKDTGDKPGEFQLWAEREKLTKTYPLPGGYHDVLGNDQGVLGMVTGMGTARAAASVMAVGLDPRFDLTEAYWLIAGIAGVDPANTTLGSAAWAEWVVDGDLGYEIDSREIPKEWPSGFVPFPHDAPYQQPVKGRGGEWYRLNPKLTDWAYQLTKNVELQDNETMKTNRERYTEHPNARQSPSVVKGDTLSSSTFWHGRLMNQWANDWVRYWTEGKGNYVTTAMEDTGTLQALTFLAGAGKVNLNRVMVLRTASNFDSQPPTLTAAQNLADENAGNYSGYLPSLEAAHRVGSKVVNTLVSDWAKYQTQTPGD